LREAARVDVPGLLREARNRRGLSQGGLARKAGVGRSTVSAYESGAMSPTVATLRRILATVDLQVHAVLEPLMADLDHRVQQMLRGPADLKGEDLLRLLTGFEKHGVSWAVDRETALAAHGLTVEHDTPCVVAVDGQALREFLFDGLTRSLDTPNADSWFEVDRERLTVLGKSLFTRYGFVRLRPVEALPTTVPVCVGETTVEVLPVHEVENAHADLADLLARWRVTRPGRDVIPA
jgi:transcriptional regulator with XRE-family HTH domain